MVSKRYFFKTIYLYLLNIYYFNLHLFILASSLSPQHDKESSTLLAQMQMQAKYQPESKHYFPHESKYISAESKHFMTENKHALQFPPPMQYMGMPGMPHLSSWQLAAH